MSYSISAVTLLRSRLMFHVTFTSENPGPLALFVDGVLAFDGTQFVYPYDKSKKAANASGVVEFALSTRGTAFTGSEVITAKTFGGFVALPLHGFREGAADVSNIAANGGILASDTTPFMNGDGSTITQSIEWATGNVDSILTQVVLPPDFDGAHDATLELWVASGSTNAATFAVLTSWDGGATVTDSADDASTKSATMHRITATIAAADIPDGARLLSLVLTPPAHATDTIKLQGAALLY